MIGEDAFLELINQHKKSSEILELGSQIVHVTSTIVIEHRESLRIRGGIIIGSHHSIFKLQTRSKHINGLELEGTTLLHTVQNEDIRQIGACVFIMGKSRVKLVDCHLYSVAGFSVWIKQESSVVLESCILGAQIPKKFELEEFPTLGRTGIACFNHTSVSVSDCIVSGFNIHGICVRGACKINIENTTIEKCAKRGIYLYQNACMSLINCKVRCVNGPEAVAGVEVNAEGDGDCVYFAMRDCQLYDNAAGNLRCKGKILGFLRTNFLDDDGSLIGDFIASPR